MLLILLGILLLREEGAGGRLSLGEKDDRLLVVTSFDMVASDTAIVLIIISKISEAGLEMHKMADESIMKNNHDLSKLPGLQQK